MATYNEWNKHFDKSPAPKLKKYISAIDVLLKDTMIEENYGYDLRSIKILINASNNMRK